MGLSIEFRTSCTAPKNARDGHGPIYTLDLVQNVTRCRLCIIIASVKLLCLLSAIFNTSYSVWRVGEC